MPTATWAAAMRGDKDCSQPAKSLPCSGPLRRPVKCLRRCFETVYGTFVCCNTVAMTVDDMLHQCRTQSSRTQTMCCCSGAPSVEGGAAKTPADN